MSIPRKVLEVKLIQLLTEDIGQGDVTTDAIVPAEINAKAEVIMKESGVIAGVEETTILGESLGLSAKPLVTDGEEVKKGKVIITFSGNARTILSFERTTLNLLSHMSGIATKTRELCKRLEEANLKTRIAATRKTAPGLLYFDKKAVSLGGGDPHRFHLDDMVLIKDNHLALCESMEKAIKRAKQKASFSKKIEVEVTRTADALKAAQAGADIIMLDNFSPKQIKETLEALKEHGFLERIMTEASGKITEENLMEYAQTQVNVISLGELTHSAKALDMSMEINQSDMQK